MMDTHKAREEESTMRESGDREESMFICFEDWSKFLFTPFPPHPVAFFSKLKNKTDSFI